MQQGSDLNPKVLQASTAAIFVSFCPSNTPITIDAKWSSFIQTIVDFNKFLWVLKGEKDNDMYIN